MSGDEAERSRGRLLALEVRQRGESPVPGGLQRRETSQVRIPAEGSLPRSSALLERLYADGFVVHSVKSCNSFSAGQLHMLREVEKLTGLPGGFIESDLVDARYYGHSNIKNRIESYLQMLAARRGASRPTEVRA